MTDILLCRGVMEGINHLSISFLLSQNNNLLLLSSKTMIRLAESSSYSKYNQIKFKIRGGMFGNTDEHYGESVKESRLKNGNLTHNDGHTAVNDIKHSIL